jgi:hypothetical protein
MDLSKAIELTTLVITTGIKVAPMVIQAVQDLKVFAVALVEKFTGKELTVEQRKEVEDSIDALHLEFQAPIPPEEEQ